MWRSLAGPVLRCGPRGPACRHLERPGGGDVAEGHLAGTVPHPLWADSACAHAAIMRLATAIERDRFILTPPPMHNVRHQPRRARSGFSPRAPCCGAPASGWMPLLARGDLNTIPTENRTHSRFASSSLLTRFRRPPGHSGRSRCWRRPPRTPASAAWTSFLRRLPRSSR